MRRSKLTNSESSSRDSAEKEIFMRLVFCLLLSSYLIMTGRNTSVSQIVKNTDFIDSININGIRYVVILDIKGKEGDKYLQLKLKKKINTSYKTIHIIDSIQIASSILFGGFEFVDFNQDGVKDVKVCLGSGGRGSNIFYAVYLFDKKNLRLNFLKGSNEYPNINFDSISKTISTVGITSSTDYRRFKIESNTLILIGGSEYWLEGEYTYKREYITKRNGDEITILIDSLKDNGESIFDKW